MSPEAITALVSIIGGGIGVKILDWIIAWSKGRMDQAQKVQRRLDREVRRRQDVEQALHIHRLALIKAGVPEAELPTVPRDDPT